MFALLSSVALAAPTFEDHLAAVPLHLTDDAPVLAERRRTVRSLVPTMIAGYGSSAVGVFTIVAGVALINKEGIMYGDIMPGLLVVAGGLGLSVSGAVVGTVAAGKLGHSLRKLDKHGLPEGPVERAPRFSVRPSINGLAGTF